jgi:plasmid stability protein
MASLQIRDFPDRLHKKLSAAAKREHRSLAQQATVLLEEALQRNVDERGRRKAILERVRSLPPLVGLQDAVALIREDRDRGWRD